MTSFLACYVFLQEAWWPVVNISIGGGGGRSGEGVGHEVLSLVQGVGRKSRIQKYDGERNKKDFHFRNAVNCI